MKKNIFAAGSMIFLGALAYAVSSLYSPRIPAALTAVEETSVATPAEAKKATPSEPETETEAEEAKEEPLSPEVLNLAYSFPDGEDSSDPAKSYAGQIFETLARHDENWISDIYAYSDITPQELASRLGRSSSAFMGKYDPKDEEQDPDDPSTWVIKSFRDIQMRVTDGDGNPVSIKSNVFDIMAMASVYTYYHGYTDHGLFLDYARSLWDRSHSYKISMSDVYYCSGCLDGEDEERLLAELAQNGDVESMEGLLEEVSGQEEEPSTQGEEIESQTEAETDSNTISSGQEADRESLAVPENSDIQEDNGIAVSQAVTDLSETQESSPVTGAAEVFLTQSQETEAGPGGNAAETVAETVEEEMAAGEPETEAETENAIEETAAAETAAETTAGSDTVETEAGETASPDGENGAAEGAQESEPAETASVPSATPSDAEPEKIPNSGSSDPSGQQSHNCPGHVDLIVNMKVCRLDGENSLFENDYYGNRPEILGVNGWEGWTEENRAHVRALASQDWYQNYGLSLSLLTTGSPLTASEIEQYMAKLPQDLSDTRKNVIRFALASVGKVPYYWGGKAACPGYDGNHFGELTGADYKGRVLRGLDCSGWISWVYWSATGERLPYESTPGLAVLGTEVSRQELKPGDIILRTGEDAHVIMFLGWTPEGRIRCIHESSAGVNNVTISERDANWPYYRRLID